MSRCFPFPPPGYEKKARTDEADILAKEKQKEKKHKKEKKDKDKKEKKDKERSKDKHKEKKDRKEKHKDKKDKKDKDKDKNRPSDEKHNEGRHEVNNGEKFDKNEQQAEEIKGYKLAPELGWGISGAEKGSGVQTVETFTVTDQRKAEGLASSEAKEKKKVGTDKKRDDLGMPRVEEKAFSNRVVGKEKIKDSNFLQRDEGMARLVENAVSWAEGKQKNTTSTDQKGTVGMARVVEKDFSNRDEGKQKNKGGIFQERSEGIARFAENAVNLAELKEKSKEKSDDKKADLQRNRDDAENAVNLAERKEKSKEKSDDKKADLQRNRDDERSSRNTKFQNLTRMDQQRVEGMGRPTEKDAEKRLEGKEKKKSKEGSDKQGDKHKGRDREKKGKRKDKDRSKEKKEREKEKAKEKSEKKNGEQDKLKNSSKDPTSTVNIKTSALDLSEENEQSFDADGNLRKRKDRDTNGFLHGSDSRPNKLPRPAFSHQSTVNGKKIDPSQPAIEFTSHRQGVPNNFKAEIKEHKVNGVVEVQPASFCSTKEIPAAQANENGEALTKPPHPDLKYLSQILSVPNMEECSQFDDQEWLFSNDGLQSKKPKVGSSVVDETPQVWAKALQIESADVCALPYVIPY